MYNRKWLTFYQNIFYSFFFIPWNPFLKMKIHQILSMEKQFTKFYLHVTFPECSYCIKQMCGLFHSNKNLQFNDQDNSWNLSLFFLKHKMFIWSFKWQAPLENAFHLYFRLLLGFRYKYIAPKSILII